MALNQLVLQTTSSKSFFCPYASPIPCAGAKFLLVGSYIGTEGGNTGGKSLGAGDYYGARVLAGLSHSLISGVSPPQAAVNVSNAAIPVALTVIS